MTLIPYMYPDCKDVALKLQVCLSCYKMRFKEWSNL